jgi:hypothetical protein
VRTVKINSVDAIACIVFLTLLSYKRMMHADVACIYIDAVLLTIPILLKRELFDSRIMSMYLHALLTEELLE